MIVVLSYYVAVKEPNPSVLLFLRAIWSTASVRGAVSMEENLKRVEFSEEFSRPYFLSPSVDYTVGHYILKVSNV